MIFCYNDKTLSCHVRTLVGVVGEISTAMSVVVVVVVQVQQLQNEILLYNNINVLYFWYNI